MNLHAFPWIRASSGNSGSNVESKKILIIYVAVVLSLAYLKSQLKT